MHHPQGNASSVGDSVAARIHRARKVAGLSQGELASSIRVHRNTIQRWEDLTNATEPGAAEIAALASALDVSASWLAGFAEATS